MLKDILTIVVQRRAAKMGDVKADAVITLNANDISERDNAALSFASTQVIASFGQLVANGFIDEDEYMRIVYRFAGETQPSARPDAPHSKQKPTIEKVDAGIKVDSETGDVKTDADKLSTRLFDAASRQHKARTRVQFQASNDRAGYEITFMQAGSANGWEFPAQVLRDSAHLWEGCNVFVDHAFGGRSVRDLGGVLDSIVFDESDQSMHANLFPTGPSKGIIQEAARIMLEDSAQPDLGFSADVIFTADAAGTVERIVQPLSVDLVIDPAFATKFLKELKPTPVM
jgi:hypothetical protein